MSAPHETVQAKPSNLNTTVLDETKLSIQGVDHYVWVLTDGLHVVFRLAETRETTLVQQMLDGYAGV